MVPTPFYCYLSPPTNIISLSPKFTAFIQILKKKVQTLRIFYHLLLLILRKHSKLRRFSISPLGEQTLLCWLLSSPLELMLPTFGSVADFLVHQAQGSLTGAPLGIMGSLTCTRREAVIQRVTQRLHIVHARPRRVTR